jgi:hypothetical protein
MIKSECDKSESNKLPQYKIHKHLGNIWENIYYTNPYKMY